MKNLIKYDLYRLFKNKLFLIGVIIAFALPLMITSLYYGIQQLIELSLSPEEVEAMDAMGVSFGSAISIINSTYAITGDMGLIILIFSGILLMVDERTGSLRNKIVCGKTRTQVFFSQFITISFFCFTLITIYCGCTVGWCAIFYGYSGWGSEEVLNLFKFIIMGSLVFIFVASLITALKFMTGKTVLSILIPGLIGFVIPLVYSGITLTGNAELIRWIKLIPSCGVTLIANSAIEWVDFGISVGSLVFFIALNTVGGALAFNKKDIK